MPVATTINSFVNIDEAVERRDGKDRLIKPEARFWHMAALVDKYIYVFGGKYPWINTRTSRDFPLYTLNVIWKYDTTSKQGAWEKCNLSGPNIPPATAAASVTAIGEDLYMFGGVTRMEGNDTLYLTNDLWKLDTSVMKWSKICIGNQSTSPSPRFGHCSWTWENKLYVFAGCGTPADGYLHEHGEFIPSEDSPNRFNNQLLSFDPATKTWKDLDNGTNKLLLQPPSPRAHAAIAPIEDKVCKVWLHGGHDGQWLCNDIFVIYSDLQLWYEVIPFTPVHVNPPGLFSHTLTAVDNERLVLHSSYILSKRTYCTHIFNTARHSWRTAESDTRNIAGFGHSATATNNDTVIICGGICDGILAYNREDYGGP